MLGPYEHRIEDASEQKAIIWVIEKAGREFMEIGQASGIDPLLVGTHGFVIRGPSTKNVLNLAVLLRRAQLTETAKLQQGCAFTLAHLNEPRGHFVFPELKQGYDIGRTILVVVVKGPFGEVEPLAEFVKGKMVWPQLCKHQKSLA
jgi:hypothetical protein